MPEALNHTITVFAGLAAVLVVASTIGAVLRWKVAGNRPHTIIDNLNTRVSAWWAMVAVMGIALLVGRSALLLLYGLISFATLREFFGGAADQPAERMVARTCFWLFLPLQYLAVGFGWETLHTTLIPGVAILLLPVLALLHGDTQRYQERVATGFWGLMMCVVALSFVPALMNLDIPGFERRNLDLIVFLMVIIQGCDVLQYIWGMTLGKRKIAPTISPSKTIEGLIGGVITAALLGAALAPLTPFDPWQAGVVALILCLSGFLGTLVMSAIKRDRGVKDWSSLIKGHGGALDRVDSLLLSGPVFYLILRYGWAQA